jgi:hypothetical protein
MWSDVNGIDKIRRGYLLVIRDYMSLDRNVIIERDSESDSKAHQIRSVKRCRIDNKRIVVSKLLTQRTSKFVGCWITQALTCWYREKGDETRRNSEIDQRSNITENCWSGVEICEGSEEVLGCKTCNRDWEKIGETGQKQSCESIERPKIVNEWWNNSRWMNYLRLSAIYRWIVISSFTFKRSGKLESLTQVLSRSCILRWWNFANSKPKHLIGNQAFPIIYTHFPGF